MSFLRRISNPRKNSPQDEDSPTITLRDLPNGVFARVVEIQSPQTNEAGALSSDCCAARLEALGLRVGKVVEKLSGMPFHGPVTLLLDGRQIAVGWNISSKVLVQPLKERVPHHEQTRTGEQQ